MQTRPRDIKLQQEGDSNRWIFKKIIADKHHVEPVVPWALCLLQISVNLPQIFRQHGRSGKPRLALLEIPQDTSLTLAEH